MKVFQLMGRVMDARRLLPAIPGSRGGSIPPRKGPDPQSRDPLDLLPLHYAACYLGRKELESMLASQTSPGPGAAPSRG